MRGGGWRVGVCEHGVRGCAHPFEVRVGVQFRSHLLKRSELLELLREQRVHRLKQFSLCRQLIWIHLLSRSCDLTMQGTDFQKLQERPIARSKSTAARRFSSVMTAIVSSVERSSQRAS